MGNIKNETGIKTVVCKTQCIKCQFRDKKTNFCNKKNMNCLDQAIVFAANCDDYTINDKLTMF